LDGVNLKVRRESGRKCVQMLVAYGVRQDGRSELLSFMRSQGESQGAWEGLLSSLTSPGSKLIDKLTLGTLQPAVKNRTHFKREIENRYGASVSKLREKLK
jgi:Transposase, Mutator family